MELEQISRQLKLLARKDDLSPPDYQRIKTLMRELRKMGMTNAQISELTEGRWAETTVKEYTRGVKVVDPQPWQSTTALFSEMLSKGLNIADVKETITLRGKLESERISLVEITELLGELKKAGINVHALVALYREWEGSGLKPLDVASNLKYKNNIEAMGFGLDALSDIAEAAKALGSPDEVVKAIGKYQNITELNTQLKSAQARLTDEEHRIKQQIEDSEQQVREVEERIQSAKDRLTQLEEEVNAKAELLDKGEKLEKLGLNAAKLGDLCTAATGMSTKHGLNRQEAFDRFFNELKEYDAALGFEAAANRWETIAETKRLESEKLRAQLDGLEMKYKERKEAVDAMESLVKQGIKPNQMLLWNRILGSFKGPQEFDRELERYQGIEKLLKSKEKEVERRESRIAELDTKVKALRQELTEIQNSIKALSNSGVREITKVKDEATATLQTFAEEMKGWGELKEQGGKFEKELIFAQYLTTDDEAVLKTYPKEILFALLERVASHCRLNGLNPMVKVPNSLSHKCRGEIALLDLINWVEAGIAGVSQ